MRCIKNPSWAHAWNEVHSSEFVFHHELLLVISGTQTHEGELRSHGRPSSILYLPQCMFSYDNCGNTKHRKSLWNHPKLRSKAWNLSWVWKKWVQSLICIFSAFLTLEYSGWNKSVLWLLIFCLADFQNFAFLYMIYKTKLHLPHW